MPSAKPMTKKEQRQLLRDLKWVSDLAEEMCGGSYPSDAELAEEVGTITIADAQAMVRAIEKRLRALVRAQPVEEQRR